MTDLISEVKESCTKISHLQRTDGLSVYNNALYEQCLQLSPAEMKTLQGLCSTMPTDQEVLPSGLLQSPYNRCLSENIGILMKETPTAPVKPKAKQSRKH